MFTDKHNIYRYLGLEFSLSGKFSKAKEDLSKRAMKAMFKLMSLFKPSSPRYKTLIHLFDHTIKPILTYGSEVWGATMIPSCNKSIYDVTIQDVIEKCHYNYSKTSKVDHLCNLTTSLT